MATRAIQDLKLSLIKTYVIKTGLTLVPGDRVKFGAVDGEVDKGAPNDDLAFGTVILGGAGNERRTATAQVVLDGHQIVPMKVGTGGATRGKKVVAAADGIIDAPPNGGGTNAGTTVGIAMQSGVPSDVIGVMPINSRFVWF